MKEKFGAIQILILIGLLALILTPRPIAGALDLQRAARFDSVGDQANAADSYALAAERIAWMPGLWETAGMRAMGAGNPETAIAHFNKAIEHNSLSAGGWLTLGEAYKIGGDVSQAIYSWERALPLARADSYLAAAQRSRGNFSAAINYWRADITLEPENSAAHYALGLLYAATAPELALPEFLRAATLCEGLDPQVQRLRTALNTAFLSEDRGYQFLVSGQALGALGEWDLAVEAFRNAVKVRSDYAEAWAWLGEAEQQMGLDGRLAIEQALSLDPTSAMVQGFYGIFLQRQKLPEAALIVFQKAASLEPGNPGWQMALGSASEQTGDLVAAYEYYVHAVELAPDDASTWKALVAFSVNNEVDVDITGMPAARKLVGLAGDDWQSYDLAGQAEFALENFPAAIIYINKAIQMSPTQAAPALHLALVYLQTGEREQAYSYLSLAKTFDPNGPLGWQAGRLLEQYFP